MEGVHFQHVDINSNNNNNDDDDPLCIRAITAFIRLCKDDFGPKARVSTKIEASARILQELQEGLNQLKFTVQTCRIATNSFTEWLIQTDSNCNSTSSCQSIVHQRLATLDEALQKCGISFCSLGPATCIQHTKYIATILTHSSRFSCSIDVLDPHDIQICTQASQVILDLSQFHVETNFRFCVQACSLSTHIPFFPAATTRYTDSLSLSDQQDSAFHIRVALGLENGPWFQHFFQSLPSIENSETTLKDILTHLRQKLTQALAPIQRFCQMYHPSFFMKDVHISYQYLGIDTSLNPALNRGMDGSIAKVLDMLRSTIGIVGPVLSSSSIPPPGLTPPGSVAAAAQITQTIQSLDEIRTTGYCGIMLPVCEDTQLATLASNHKLDLIQLLAISSVCGVGIDTVPLPGNVSIQSLTALIMDVVGLAHKWKKPLTCRVFPCPGLEHGDLTQFDSPYLCNCRVLDL